jgi:RNA polymerase sigma-70 factor, ECF subfamily
MKQPDSDRISRLFQLHAPMVLNAAFRVLRERSLAEDVLQETFLRFFQMKDRVDETKGIPGLLRKISVNLSIDILRKRGRERPLETDEDWENESTPDAPLRLTQPEGEKPLLVRQLLDQLPSLDRIILEFRYGEQLSYQEISETLDLSVDAVAQRIRRAKEALRQEFEPGKRRKI